MNSTVKTNTPRVALVRALSERGWQVVTDARRGDRLRSATAGLPVLGVPGDIRLPRHRAALVEAAQQLGRLDLLVHNASDLGPMQELEKASSYSLADVFATNVEAPWELTRAALPLLRA